jgi:hypothetical protein
MVSQVLYVRQWNVRACIKAHSYMLKVRLMMVALVANQHEEQDIFALLSYRIRVTNGCESVVRQCTIDVL